MTHHECIGQMYFSIFTTNRIRNPDLRGTKNFAKLTLMDVALKLITRDTALLFIIVDIE